jgi:predicted site-specific integrase-resolvase
MRIGEAAKILGVTVRSLRWAIEHGRVAATVEPLCGWWDIPDDEVTRCARDHSWHHARGWVRGRTRSVRGAVADNKTSKHTDDDTP